MAVRLDINANVRGTNQVNQLNRAVGRLGTRAGRSAAAMASLEAAAVRGRASFAALATTLNIAVVGGLAAVGFGLSRFIRATFQTGDLIEGLGIRFELLFGSVEEGGKAFEALADFAARVPFSLADIAAGSGNLAVVSKDANDLANILEITGNVAAATGLDFRQTAEQIQRAFAGGIAAADVFRERGVRAMLGFQSGVTVSIEETVQRFEEVFSGNGRFARATGLLAETLQGQLSLVDDAFFSFRRSVADTFFSALTAQVRGIVGDIATNSEQITRIAERIGTGLGTAFLNLEKIGRSLIRNFQLIADSIRALIAYKIAGVFGGIVAAVAQYVISIRAAAVGTTLFNAVLRANPIGLIITAIQLAVAGFIFFEDEIRNGLAVALEYLNEIFIRVSDRIIRLVRLLNVLPGVNIMIMTSQERINAALIEGEKASLRFGVATRDAAKAFTIVDGEAKILKDTLDSINQTGSQDAAAGGASNDDVITTGAAVVEQSVAIREALEAAAKATIAGDLEMAATEAQTLRTAIESLGITSGVIGNTIADQWIEGFREGSTILERIQNSAKALFNTIIETIIRNTINLAIERLFEQLGQKKIDNEKMLNQEKQKGFLISKAEAALAAVRGFATTVLGFQDGGIVPNTPGSTPGRDSVPALLTPGERVIPVSAVDNGGEGDTYVTNITQNLSTRNLNDALIEAIRTQAEDVNAILEAERNNQ